MGRSRSSEYGYEKEYVIGKENPEDRCILCQHFRKNHTLKNHKCEKCKDNHNFTRY